MHDPNIVAFEIRSPFKKRVTAGFSYRPPIITIWHHDPEVGGDDDSCGYSFANLTAADRKWAKELAASEHDLCFRKKYANLNLLDADDLSIMHYAWLAARRRVTGQHRAKEAFSRDIAQIFQLLSHPTDNFRHLIQRAREKQSGLEELFALTLRVYLTDHRPWWRHPRWHIHHWRIQIHPWQKFVRWAFSRCAGCGRGFRWGYAPTSGGWCSLGPTLRGEKNVWHRECYEARSNGNGTHGPAGVGVGGALHSGLVSSERVDERGEDGSP